jgi:hypothetical protein
MELESAISRKRTCHFVAEFAPVKTLPVSITDSRV